MEALQKDYDPTLGFSIKGKAKQRDAPQDTCVICLDTVTERAVAVPCNHLNFDFLCLCSWTQEHPSCPLCKTPLTAIEYDWRSPTDRKVYTIPKKEDKPKAPAATTNTNRFHLSRRRPAQIVPLNTATSRPPPSQPLLLSSPVPACSCAASFRLLIFWPRTTPDSAS